jgi:Rap1 Myb domain.
MLFLFLFFRRQAYQPEEDDAIVQYVSMHKGDYGMDGSIGGNLIWKQMQEKKVL